jgi:hypothetical protein
VICAGAAGSTSRSASHAVNVRSELVETATDAGDLVAIVRRSSISAAKRSSYSDHGMSPRRL